MVIQKLKINKMRIPIRISSEINMRNLSKTVKGNENNFYTFKKKEFS